MRWMIVLDVGGSKAFGHFISRSFVLWSCLRSAYLDTVASVAFNEALICRGLRRRRRRRQQPAGLQGNSRQENVGAVSKRGATNKLIGSCCLTDSLAWLAWLDVNEVLVETEWNRLIRAYLVIYSMLVD